MEDSSFVLSNLSNFSSAKIKLDELFIKFLAHEGSQKIIQLLSRNLRSLTIESEEEKESPLLEKVPSSGAAAVSSLTNAALGVKAATNNLIKKSPKKRTQAEMLNASNGSVTNASLAATPGSSTSTSNSPSTVATTSPASGAGGVNAPSLELSRMSLTSLDDGHPITNNLLDPDQLPEDHTNLKRRANFDKIPIFYVPGKKATHLIHINEEDKLSKRLPEIESFFKPFPGGIPMEKFVHVTKRLCGIPSFFNLPLCKRINERFGDADSGIPPPRTIGRAGRQPSGVKIKLKSFLKFWSAEIEPYDRIERFFRIIKKHEADYIYKDDFVPFLQELLHFHPGLDFLEQHEEFQRKYALTVITRIFYKVNTSRTGKISLHEIRRSNLFSACMHVDEETDINRVLDYFSYEHFYVIYCKFFELDTDKDSKISKADLLRYGDHALTETIVDRIFQMGTRVFSDGEVGSFETTGMAYPDFIYFMLSEEDKTTEVSLRYWFRCCDLDGDGKLTPEEMRYFYRNQIHRITSLGQESINFPDVLCQMMDMVSPQDPYAITIEDLIRPDKRMIAGVLFDVLFNLHKFMRFESRDPFQEKLRREDIFHTDWDRYAHIEYNRLAQEDDDGYDVSMDVDMQNHHTNGNNTGGAMETVDHRLGNEVESLGNWSLNDEESEDEDDNNSSNSSHHSNNSNSKQWSQRR